MSDPYIYDCTNVVYMFCVYCIYYYVNKFEARSLFSTSHLYIVYALGPMTYPCGTPWLSGTGSDFTPRITTDWVLSSGVSRIISGGVQNFFSGASSPEKFFKNGAFWCVLESILLKFCPHFLYQNR